MDTVLRTEKAKTALATLSDLMDDILASYTMKMGKRTKDSKGVPELIMKNYKPSSRNTCVTPMPRVSACTMANVWGLT
ncbi:hypothetical protein ASPSYDRAFT_1051820 [Aspergillus sydowii CBS 593.65]|uniref:Uncharacterized protein n=1 Tax=Aspergillus sydowii CBS 593.65 TaxID=1036612 RepID=A0A1L9TD70_9EURO|nr:uncharacterized protein ASPSYDRAFT_1051820 [Aspergillus sydowii CBS 593.65]OJJ57362.1 hypothetical protein ASPSYDRAFT_1051820 [Aspergillus sydowii CBS 593.65]